MRTLSLLLVAVISVAHPIARPTAPLEQINANENRITAGSLKDGVLTVHLELRRGTWYPDGSENEGLDVFAFGEAGRPLQIPGPLLRVTEGTLIHAFIRNTLPDSTLIVHGLYMRDQTPRADKDTIRIAPGTTREVRFEAGKAGTYYYWGATNSVSSWQTPHQRIDSQLGGALIVDPRGASATARDRVFVIGVWTSVPIQELNEFTQVVTRFAINGRSWPHTERFQFSLGDSVHWRLINASSAPHPMHLHGFYFRVNSRGAEDVDNVSAVNAAPDLAVTERLAPGRTATIAWSPDRPGNWLFHCHDNMHIRPSQPLNEVAAASKPVAMHNHANELMGGLVIGVQVNPRPGESVKASDPERRKLRLIARADPGGTPKEPSFGFTLEGAGVLSGNPTMPGPPIVLQRGEPVSITVVNELAEPTAVHWHGIELESYFDGVAGFSGQSARISPLIAPRDSFDARFTPPRAGTFIYHTHVNEVRQQRAGLAGALIVLEPGERYDPATDIVLLITTPRLDADRETVMLNGSTAPAPLELRAGTRYRLRVINIHTYRPSIRVELKRDTTMLTWRAFAKDGARIPPERATERRSAIQMGNGETYDFEFTPAAPGDIKIDLVRATGALLLTQPIHVR